MITVDFSEKCCLADPQALSGFGFIISICQQSLLNQLLLHLFQRAGLWGDGRLCVCTDREELFHCVITDLPALGDYDQFLYHVRQFPDISRPVVLLQCSNDLFVDSCDAAAEKRVFFLNQIVDHMRRMVSCIFYTRWRANLVLLSPS